MSTTVETAPVYVTLAEVTDPRGITHTIKRNIHGPDASLIYQNDWHDDPEANALNFADAVQQLTDYAATLAGAIKTFRALILATAKH